MSTINVLETSRVKSLFIEILHERGLIGDGEKAKGLGSPRVLGLCELFKLLERSYLGEGDLRLWADGAINFYQEIASSPYQKTITVNVTRHYGAVSVELGITQSVFMTSHDATKIQLALLTEHVHDLHRQYAMDHLRGKIKDDSAGGSAGAGGAVGGAVGGAGQLASNHAVMPAEEIVIMKDGKKSYFKVKGGKYAEFGVRIWPEVLKSAGLEVSAITDSLPVSGSCIIELNDKGNPTRVLELKLDDKQPV